ncbi:MAG: sulfite exporter TauE/SafE family protein [Rhodospirillales bacterium]|nr:sulfite exporter TauE/SafE family protein [Rhodospirillales bacterium]
MSDLLHLWHLAAVAVAGLCTPAVARGSLMLGLLAAGAAGGAMHCGPMCGGFVLGQVADRMARLPAAGLCERHRVGSALLLPYHLGRMTTYAGLGAAAAATVAVLGRAPWFGGLSALLLGLAALLFLSEALRRAVPALAPLLPAPGRVPPRWSRSLARITTRIDRSRPGGGYLLGVALGFLPCGFLYSALTAAAATRTPLLGAAAMASFALGTMPALIVVGLAGQAAGRRFGRSLTTLAPAVLAGNAALLLLLAWQAA